MTRSLLCACVLVAALSATSQAETITLALPEMEGSHNGKIEVLLNVQGAKNLVATQFVVVHDPAVLKVAQVESGSVFEQALVENNFDKPGRLWVASASMNPITADGELLRITYDVIGEVGKKSPLTIEKAEAWQSNETEILVQTKAGAITVRPGAVAGRWGLVLLIGILAGVAGAVCLLLLRRRSSLPAAPPVARAIVHPNPWRNWN